MTEPYGQAMNWAQVAAAVWQACSHVDPYLPKLSEDMARAWGRQFATAGLEIGDLLAGVDRAYRDNGSGFRPLPKDILDAARAARRDRRAAWTDADLAEYEARCDAKAGVVVTLADVERDERTSALGQATPENLAKLSEHVDQLVGRMGIPGGEPLAPDTDHGGDRIPGRYA